MNAGNKGKKVLIGLAACAALLGARKARAEIVLYDKDTWTLKTDGLAQGFYMLSMGDSAQVGGTAPIDHDFDFLDSPPPGPDGKFVSSRFRSGWTGGRFNWRATKQMTPDTKASAYLGIAYSISTQNAPAAPGCYTSGYGVKFPGFWAGMFYTTPDLSGLKIKVGAMDPVQVGEEGPMGAPVPYSSLWPKTPLPHFQTLITYNLDAGMVKAMVHFNGFWQRIGRNFTPPGSMTAVSQWRDPLGGGAGLDLTIDIFKIGGGGSFEHGTNLYVPLVGSETVDGNGTLRDGTSLYADAMLTLGPVDLAAGYGQATLKRTAYDEVNSPNINKVQRNIHGSIQYHIAPLTFVADLNLLHHEWYAGNKQDVQVVSLGANFAY